MTVEVISHNARRAMEDPALTHAFSQIEKDIIEEWKTCGSTQLREALWHRLQALSVVRHQIGANASAHAVSQHNVRSIV